MESGQRARPLLQLEHIAKSFGDVVANDDISFAVDGGEVVSLLGENGAGKSTLMKITYGLARADSGQVSVDGEPLNLRSPRSAMAAGIGMVTQEFSLVNTMTVAENIALSGVGYGPVDRLDLHARVVAVMDRVGVHLPLERRVADLSIGERQRVEIIKALYHDCRVLILDEPTAVLTPQDVDSLFATIRELRRSGLGVIFISHKLREVAEISDRVVVLRHGRVVADRPIAEVDEPTLAALMMGVTRTQTTGAIAPASIGASVAEPAAVAATAGAPILQVTDVVVRREEGDPLRGLSLTVHEREIVGIAGISGNGQSQLVDVLAGVLAPTSGTVTLGGADLTHADVETRLRAGLGRLTEDRRGTVFAAMSVEQNLAVEDLDQFRSMGLLNRRSIRAHAEKLIEQFAIKARPTDLAGTLSGGNIQKILLARAFHRNPKVLVAAQPTRGLDIRTSEYVHEMLIELRDSGAGVLLISEDLDELRALSDRIVVIFRGEIVGEFAAGAASAQRLGIMMTGGSAAA